MTIGSMTVRSAEKASKIKSKATVIQRPQGRRIPHSGFGSNALWICMRPMELDSQTTANRGLGIKIGAELDIFKFLAPPHIMETVSHEWAAYESMTSRLQEKQREAMKLGEDIKALGTAAGKIGTMISTGTQAGMISGLKSAGQVGIGIPKTRVDSPLVYQTSERRQWEFTFQLISDSDPVNDIIYPVKELMRLSCPEAVDQSVSISFPYIFKLYTEPGNLIFAQYAALTSVQPTWKEPFRHGYPTGVELTCTFKDLSPLFRSLISRSRLVNVPGAATIDETQTFVRKAVRGRASEAVGQVTRTLPSGIGIPAIDSYVSVGKSKVKTIVSKPRRSVDQAAKTLKLTI